MDFILLPCSHLQIKSSMHGGACREVSGTRYQEKWGIRQQQILSESPVTCTRHSIMNSMGFSEMLYNFLFHR